MLSIGEYRGLTAATSLHMSRLGSRSVLSLLSTSIVLGIGAVFERAKKKDDARRRLVREKKLGAMLLGAIVKKKVYGLSF